MVRCGVVHVPFREILQVPKFSTIWVPIPHDMMSLMCHIVGALNCIETFTNVAHDSTKFGPSCDRPTSSPPPGSLLPHPSPPRVSPSTDHSPSPPHVSPYIVPPPPPLVSPSTDPCPSPSHVSPSTDPPTSPPHVSPSTNPHPSPPHVSPSTDHPPPPPTLVSQFIYVVDIMFTSSVAQLDPSGETYESTLISSLLFDIGTDRPSTYNSIGTYASGSSDGPS
uniref:Uncharacterized protein n=1 Tax=Picea sitchensis TaxID=3332 RepID=D5ABC7_PICSI|nr:unknown [Picea sitchensis]